MDKENLTFEDIEKNNFYRNNTSIFFKRCRY